MFACFLTLSLCYFPFQAPVVEGTTESWVSDVSEFVEGGGVCFIMFVQKRSPRCKEIFPDFQEAANISEGMVKYLSVDVKEHPKIAYLYTVRAVPAFRIVNSKGSKEYKGDTSSESLVDAGFKMIPNRAKLADETWLPSATTPMQAVLMTKKKVIPAFWAAISCNCASDTLRIGYTRSPALMNKIAAGATIAFTYRDIVSVYEGPLTYAAVKEAMENFEKNPKANAMTQSLVSDVTEQEQFEKVCRNTGKICVFEAGQNNTQFEDVAKTNHHGPFRFFRCIEKCPFNGMKNYVIFHGKRDNVINIESLEDLPGVLDRIIDGGAKWSAMPPEFKEEL